MKLLSLFTDGSVNPQLKIGFGAFLVVEDFDSDIVQKLPVQIKKFENTSSTILELQTLLWALEEVNFSNTQLNIYTDCQNLMGLKARCQVFEENGYRTKSNKLIANHELYREFYEKIKMQTCEFIKIKGHKKSSIRDEMDAIFTRVDKASRNALREEIMKIKSKC